MALQTPRQRLQRPSYGNSSGEKPSSLSASTAVARKASLQALTGQGPRTPSGKMDGGDLDVGDSVNVPGDMYGTVKFIGTVRGKAGKFVGVELDKVFAARGKNDGDVDGTHYFNTTVPGAGIFLPVHRAEKRTSPAISIDSFPATPNTPSYSTVNGHRTKAEAAYTPPTPAVPHKFSQFSQSVGPGARPVSPQLKPKRPSLPRPESPFRKQPPNLAPTPARALSQSTRGVRPNLAPTTSPSRTNLRSSTNTRPQPSHTPRPYSRTGSRLGNRQPDSVAEEESTPAGYASTRNGRTTSTNSVPSFSQPLRSPSRLGSAGGPDAEIQRLKKELAERDRRLEEQALSLAEMDSSVKELSALMPADGVTPGGRQRGGELGDDDDQNAAQLRQLLREKNEKIGVMTQDFDSHRADFRSTLDSLEMASTETERVYEEQKRDLEAQIAELQSQNESLQQEVGMGSSKEDFESVARQLKQLEELVAELEEGLEESRRGEAEARGEVEFLRGEVERGRSELKREREKAAAMSRSGSSESASTKELDQKDDEIRGLKAIVHSLSSGSDLASTNGAAPDAEELKRLQDELEESRLEKEDLEKELEQLRRDSAMTNGNGHGVTHIRNESERTATAPESGTPHRQRSGTVKATFAEHARRSGLAEEDISADANGEDEGAEHDEGIYCEMCESRDHDTLDCTKLSKPNTATSGPTTPAAAGTLEPTYSPGKENEQHTPPTSGKQHTDSSKPMVVDEDKWCALCEKDGHLAFDCPEEQY